jgi:hypothetical protein
MSSEQVEDLSWNGAATPGRVKLPMRIVYVVEARRNLVKMESVNAALEKRFLGALGWCARAGTTTA